MAYIKLYKYEERDPEIQDRAKPILESARIAGYFNYINTLQCLQIGKMTGGFRN